MKSDSRICHRMSWGVTKPHPQRLSDQKQRFSCWEPDWPALLESQASKVFGHNFPAASCARPRCLRKCATPPAAATQRRGPRQTILHFRYSLQSPKCCTVFLRASLKYDRDTAGLKMPSAQLPACLGQSSTGLLGPCPKAA